MNVPGKHPSLSPPVQPSVRPPAGPNIFYRPVYNLASNVNPVGARPIEEIVSPFGYIPQQTPPGGVPNELNLQQGQQQQNHSMQNPIMYSVPTQQQRFQLTRPQQQVRPPTKQQSAPGQATSQPSQRPPMIANTGQHTQSQPSQETYYQEYSQNQDQYYQDQYNQSIFPGNMQMIIQGPTGGPPYVMPSQPPLIMPPQPAVQMPQYQRQYTITTPQPTQQFQPNAASFYPQQPSNTVYYPPTYNVQQQAQPATRAPAQQTQTSHYQPRKRNIIPIVDPDTGKTLNEEGIAGGSSVSGGSSQKSTPPTSNRETPNAPVVAKTPPIQPAAAPASAEGNDIAAEFAAKVAATLGSKEEDAKVQSTTVEETKSSASNQGESKEEVAKPGQTSSLPNTKVLKNKSDSNETTVLDKTATTAAESPKVESDSTAAVTATTASDDKPTPTSKEATPQQSSATDTPARKAADEGAKQVEKESSKLSQISAKVEEEKKTDESKKKQQKSKNKENESASKAEQPERKSAVDKKETKAQNASEGKGEVIAPVASSNVAKSTESHTPEDKSSKNTKPSNPPATEKIEVPSVEVIPPTTPPIVDSKPPLNPSTKNAEKKSTEHEQQVSAKNERNDLSSASPKDLDRPSKEEEELEEGEILDDDEDNDDMETTAPVIHKDKTELKYKYREDQWSPINKEGKKEYDRNFLLQLQYAQVSTQKPQDLPDIQDVVLNQPLNKNAHSMGRESRGMRSHGSYPNFGGGVDFTPGFFKDLTPKEKNTGGRRSQQKQQRDNMPPRKVINISLGQDIKLHHTENRWQGHSKSSNSNKELTEEEKQEDEVVKKVRGILNKLTPQKFQTLTNQVLEIEINSERILNAIIVLIFEKAIDEPSFSVAYANLCKILSSHSKSFLRLLLTRCQMEFQKDKADEEDINRRLKEIEDAPEEDKKRLSEEMEFEQTKSRRRSLGNIRFIGELFKLSMLTPAIMHECLFKLLRANEEESLECLCRLLTTVGKELDQAKYKRQMSNYFEQMQKIIRERKTSSRIRFMLQDVLDLRMNDWTPRRDDNAPKTIDQIHADAKKEAIQRAEMAANTPIQPARSSSARKGRPPPPASEDGWQPVSGTKMTRQTIDHSKLKVSGLRQDTTDIQLGPRGRGGFSGWGRGSSGGGRSSSQEKDNRPSQNRYMALRDQSHGGSDTRGRGGTPSREDKSRRSGGGGSASRGKYSGRPSLEQEREAALASVKSIVGAGQRTPGSSRNQSRDSSQNRDRSSDRRAAGIPDSNSVKKGYDEDELRKKTKAILDEYLHINDLNEAVECFKELDSPSNIYIFVTKVMEDVLERSKEARRLTGVLVHKLIQKGHLSIEDYLRGIKEVLCMAEDYEIDIPMIWTYLGELIGPMVQDGVVPLSFLRQATEPLGNGDKAGILVAAILEDASHNIGHHKVGELWRASGLRWSEFLPESSVDEFIARKKLEYTVVEEPRSPDAKKLSDKMIKDELYRLLVKEAASNETIMDWIEVNVGDERTKTLSFIRSLMTAVCENAIIVSDNSTMKTNPEKIKSVSVLLLKYLDHKADRELQALFALQSLVHQLQHPSGLLRSFFDSLYDEDIISEDAFYQWYNSTDPAESQGKGVANSSVVQFFTWLQNAEEDSQ